MGQEQQTEMVTHQPPVKKPEGTGESKPRKLTAPSLARSTVSQEVDDTMKSKELPQWMKDTVRDRKIDEHIEKIRTRGLKSGTIKKAMSFVNKAGAPGAFAGAVAQRAMTQAKPAMMGRPRGGMYRSKNTVRNPGNPVAEQEQGFR